MLKNILLISNNKNLAQKLATVLKKHKYKIIISSNEKKEIEEKIDNNFIEIIWFLPDILDREMISFCSWIYKKYPTKLYFRWCENVAQSSIKNCKIFKKGECKSAFLFFKNLNSLIERFEFLLKRNYLSILGKISKETLDILFKISKKSPLPIFRNEMYEYKDLSYHLDINLDNLIKNIGTEFVKRIKTFFHADKISLFSYDLTKNTYVCVSSYGFIKDKEEITTGRGWELIQKAVSLRKPLLIQNGIIHYPELKKLDIKPQPKIISSMVLPIVSNKNIIGVLNIARLSPKKEKFNEFDFNLAQYWCSWLVLAYSIILGFKLSVEYDKMKCDFVSVINHELRTPLMAILGSIELVANRIPQNIYDIIIRNINRLRSLIEELLDFSKISKGIFKIEKKENNISEIINEIFEEYKPLCDSNNVKLIVEKNIKADICFVDKERIKQVLINLISNSLKWYPEDRQEKYIKISVEEKDDYYLFSVEDNAQGMKKEDLDKLFQPFIQLGDVMTQHKPGLGIGLVINKSIIEEHKGKIWVESEYGKGTKVNFIIPKK